MRKKAIFPVLLVIIALAATLLAFRARTDKEAPCKESLDACSGKKEGGKMIWENLSQQFFSSL